MTTEQIVKDWFTKWETGDFLELPLTDDFEHTSPFGTIAGRAQYLATVEANRDKFLGYTFTIHDALYGADKACIRYTAKQGEFSLDVSEWHYLEHGLIREIVAYYHIGDIREDRELDAVD